MNGNTLLSPTNSSPGEKDIKIDIDTIISDDKNKKNDKPKLIWSYQTEELLASWCDISTCYKWLHNASFRKYKKLNHNYSIPIIVMSTITGALGLGLNSLFPIEYVNTATNILAAVNIITGIVTTLQNLFKYAQCSESHLNAGSGWAKLQRSISTELRIEKVYRKDAESFLKVCRSEYDRLLEQSPIIPQDIIKDFTSTIIRQDLIIPDICGNLEHTSVYRELNESKILPEIQEALLKNYDKINYNIIPNNGYDSDNDSNSNSSINLRNSVSANQFNYRPSIINKPPNRHSFNNFDTNVDKKPDASYQPIIYKTPIIKTWDGPGVKNLVSKFNLNRRQSDIQLESLLNPEVEIKVDPIIIQQESVVQSDIQLESLVQPKQEEEIIVIQEVIQEAVVQIDPIIVQQEAIVQAETRKLNNHQQL